MSFGPVLSIWPPTSSRLLFRIQVLITSLTPSASGSQHYGSSWTTVSPFLFPKWLRRGPQWLSLPWMCLIPTSWADPGASPGLTTQLRPVSGYMSLLQILPLNQDMFNTLSLSASFWRFILFIWKAVIERVGGRVKGVQPERQTGDLPSICWFSLRKWYTTDRC